jgi:hypothetical protein
MQVEYAQIHSPFVLYSAVPKVDERHLVSGWVCIEPCLFILRGDGWSLACMWLEVG